MSRMMAPGRLGAIVRLLLTACAAVAALIGCSAAPTPTPPATPPAPTQPVPSGITVVDPRLLAPMLTIVRHPEWAPGSTADLHAHRAVATFPELCVEVLRPNLPPLYVAVDVDALPWTVKSIVLFDPATDEEPTVSYENGDPDGDPDTCRFVLSGSREPFPGDPSLVEVNGPIQDPAHAAAIARAIVEQPQLFGLDRSFRPAVNLDIPLRPTPAGTVCYPAVVYQGGPRAAVLVTLLRGDGGWRVHHVEITRQALHTPGPRPDGAC